MAMAPVSPLSELIQEIGSSSWLIGKRIVLTRQSSSNNDISWADGNGSFYSLSEVSSSDPLPEPRPLPDTSEIRKVYDAGGASAVWAVGEAFCKVKILDPQSTREHVTLAYLKERGPFSFEVPEVHHHAEHDGLYFIFLTRIPGDTLTQMWPGMNEATKHQAVSRVAEICAELAQVEVRSDYVTGVDGSHLSDQYFLQRDAPKDCDPQNLAYNCKALGLDTSSLVFYHCDLGPGNIIMDSKGGVRGIIDWETVGFVPREWIRTKFRVSGGLDLPGDDIFTRGDWRKRVQLELGRRGYPEIAERWMEWWYKFAI